MLQNKYETLDVFANTEASLSTTERSICRWHGSSWSWSSSSNLGRRCWVYPLLSTVARSFFLFLWMQLKSAFFFLTQFCSTLILNRVTYILWSQFLIVWLATIFIQSGTKFIRKIQNPKPFWTSTQSLCQIKAAGEFKFLCKFLCLWSMCNNWKDWHDLHCVKYSEINSHIHKSAIQLDSLNRCFCSVAVGFRERLMPICMSVRSWLNWFFPGQTQWTAHQWAILPIS